MTMWWVWHVRNEINHDKTPPPAESSHRFLQSYINSLLCINQHPAPTWRRGRWWSVLTHHGRRPAGCPRSGPVGPPTTGWAKLNTNDSFIAATGATGGGMVLRDDRGDIIFSTCRRIHTCDSALEAELLACRKGLDLALHRTMMTVIVEMGSAEAVAMLTAPTTSKSPPWPIVHEIRNLTERHAREIIFLKCNRAQNITSHEMVCVRPP
ncbi:hypothetical protein ZWY2020_016369 [Hordeum vulgare]|nr:hypothetical protein ZWY2020_016369 [Hordeum vulgare]